MRINIFKPYSLREVGIIHFWPVDSLVKVFQETLPGRSVPRPIRVITARGCVESAQCAFRSTTDLADFKISIEPPCLKGGKEKFDNLRWRRVEYVPVRRSSWYLDETERLKNGSAFFPDPLIPEAEFDKFYAAPWGKPFHQPKAAADTTVPLWITIPIAQDAEPGLYRGAVVLTAGKKRFSLVLEIEVTAARLPQKRNFGFSHWFSEKNIASTTGVERFSEGYWKLLAAWAHSLHRHRVTHLFTPLHELIGLRVDKKGILNADFSRFDKWVETFQGAGWKGIIEGSHLGYRPKWESPFSLFDFTLRHPDGRKESLKQVPFNSPKAKSFLSQFLPALTAHLAKRKWLSRYVQHLADEPIPSNMESYRALATLVRKYAPELKRMDAVIADGGITGCVNLWCPQAQHAEKDAAFFRERQKAGDDVWFYTCLLPNRNYPNRFINQPLLAPRVLPWFAFKQGLTGYLHWGCNFWKMEQTAGTAQPYSDTELSEPYGKASLVAGDTHIVYPDSEGRPLDSIRHEMVLEGIQDYEMLCLLSEKDPVLARKLACAIVPELTRYERRPVAFRRVREKLLKALARYTSSQG